MVASVGEEAVRIVPGLLWIAFAAAVLAVFYKPIRDDLIPRLSTLKLPGGIEVALLERVTNAAEKQNVEVSQEDKSRIVRRLERSSDLLRGARILWVDDHPENNSNEVAILATFGVSTTFARTTRKALDLLSHERFDVVISDNERDGQPNEGIRFVEETRGDPWTILYIGDYKPELGTPPYAFAITDRPHQLLHYVLDALARQRG
jgi:CheY-like chemotaxis protein